jgi:hypothetical protein
MNTTTHKSGLILGLFLLMGQSFSSHAQAQWQWGKRGGSIGTGSGALTDERVIDIATDQRGNVYVLANDNPGGPANVDGHAGISTYDWLTLASWDCKGSFRWRKNLGSAALFMGRGLDVDTLGGVYFTGSLAGNNALQYAYFDADSTLPATNKGMYLAKYDTAGKFQWLRMPQADTFTFTALSNYHTSAYQIEVAPNGDGYLFCHLSPGAYANGRYITTAHGFHLLHYDRNGNFISGRRMEISVSTDSYGPELINMEAAKIKRNHRNGRIYIYGDATPYGGALTFGTTLVTNVAGAASSPIYVAAFDSTGHNLWLRQSSTDSAMTGRQCKPVIDEAGNIYIGGDANINGNSFNGHRFTNTLSPFMMVPFVISLDSNGNNRWVSAGNSTALTTGSTLACRNGKVYLCGSYLDQMEWGGYSVNQPGLASGYYAPYIVALNAANGHIQQLDTLVATPGLNVFTAAIMDKNSNLYAGGSFNQDIQVGKDALAKYGGSLDWFVAKHGTASCGCKIPVPTYTASATGGNSFSFTYTGTPYSSISWDFGDGSVSSAGAPVHTYSAAGSYTVCVTVTDTCGSNAYCNKVTTSGTGISELPQSDKVRLYPNPASGLVQIEHTAACKSLKIYDATGRLVQQQNLQGTHSTLDITAFSPGVYIVLLIDEAGNCYKNRLLRN